MSHMNESCHIWMSYVTYEWVMSHMNESCHILCRLIDLEIRPICMCQTQDSTVSRVPVPLSTSYRLSSTATWRQPVGHSCSHGVPLVDRIDSIIGLFCKRDLQKPRNSAKETCNLIDLTDRSHPIHFFIPYTPHPIILPYTLKLEPQRRTTLRTVNALRNSWDATHCVTHDVLHCITLRNAM